MHNTLLRSLPVSDQKVVRSQLQREQLRARQRLESPRTEISRIYFPEECVISTFAISMRNRRKSDIGLVGFDGMTGLPQLYGVERSPNELVVICAGAALSLTAAQFSHVFESCPALRQVIRRYAYAFSVQTQQTALANAHGRIVARLARLLLMVQDRNCADHLDLTHDAFAQLLGTRRAGITTALADLEVANLIERSRGRLMIVDRAGLVAATRGFYGVAEQEYETLLPRAAQLTS